MTKRLLPFFVITAILAVMAIPSYARTNSNDSISATIDLDSKANLNKTALVPGQYKVVAQGNQSKFEKDGKIVAEVPCTLKNLSRKANHNEFFLDHDRLTEIRVSGKNQAIELSSGQNSGD
jgi:hypothetical protein